MTYWGTTVSGQRMLLGEPTEAALRFDEDAPADLLRVRFPAERCWEELSELCLCEGEETVFRGVVDEQNTSLDGDGVTVELICRSKEALLLDNEAAPGMQANMDLESLEDRLLEPLGLLLGEGDRTVSRAGRMVKKGQSCWTVLAGFCEEALGLTPWVDGEGLVQCVLPPVKKMEPREVLSAQLSLLPCERISRVVKQSFRGSYDTVFQGERETPPRVRYLSAESRKDPRAVLEEARRESVLLTVTCPGNWWPGKAALVSVSLPRLGRWEDCPVRAALYTKDGNGERTRLTLERGTERSEDDVAEQTVD